MKNTSWYSDMFQNEDRQWWFVGRRAIIRKVLDGQGFSSHPLHPPRILEVGCGTGGNLALLSSYGSLYAMEPNPEAREMARSRTVCDVQDGSLPCGIPFEGTFELICALDVLEYVEDDLAALRGLHSRLTPNGRVLLTVPAYMFLWSYHDVAVGNRRRYARSELAALAVKAGFTTAYSTYFNTFLFPMVAIARAINRITHRVEKSDVRTPARAVNAVLRAILSCERRFIPRHTFPFGVSIMMVLKKTE
jgi:SAM-dependent methyltransferase